MLHRVLPAVISVSWEAVCPLPVLVLLPLLLPCWLRGALLCNARCIRCIFIRHYFTPQRPSLETGDAAIWKRGLTLCCVTLRAVLTNFSSRHASINSPGAPQTKRWMFLDAYRFWCRIVKYRIHTNLSSDAPLRCSENVISMFQRIARLLFMWL